MQRRRVHLSIYPEGQPGPGASGMRMRMPLGEGPASSPEASLRNAAVRLLEAGRVFCAEMDGYRGALMRAGKNRGMVPLETVEAEVLIGDTTHDEEEAARSILAAYYGRELYDVGKADRKPPAVSVMKALIDEGMKPATAAKLIARLSLTGVVGLDIPGPSERFCDDEPETQR